MQRELLVADHLAAKGAKSARTSKLLPPGPHQHHGLTMTFWEFIETEPSSPQPAQTGSLLCELHEALADFPIELPRLSPVVEGLSILDRCDLDRLLRSEGQLTLSRAVDRVRHRIDQQVFDCRPLLGDAHYGNLWKTLNGFIWGDFEDACSGPIEWDVACMVASSYVFGTGRAAASAIQGFGGKLDHDLLDLFVEARTLQGVAWALISLPEPSKNQRLRKRTAWLARRD